MKFQLTFEGYGYLWPVQNCNITDFTRFLQVSNFPSINEIQNNENYKSSKLIFNFNFDILSKLEVPPKRVNDKILQIDRVMTTSFHLICSLMDVMFLCCLPKVELNLQKRLNHEAPEICICSMQICVQLLYYMAK